MIVIFFAPPYYPHVGLNEEREFDKALSKIKEYRANQFSSGFGFGDKDFYDLAKEYCEKNYR